MKTNISVGVLGIQGDVEENKTATQEALDHSSVMGSAKFVRYAEDIENIDGIILPGGESTVISTLATLHGETLHTIRRRIAQGMPALGTCAGMIMLAKRAYDRVVGETKQQLLSNLDIVVERNAFGRQEDSFEAELSIPFLDKNNKTFRGVFIRAPVVTEVGADVDIIAKFNNRIVGVRQGNVIGTSFHPELSGDDRIHTQFIKIVLEYKRKIIAQQNQTT